MWKALLCFSLVVAIAYCQDEFETAPVLKSIKCNLCAGSTSSDCANAKKDSMAVQECQTIILPRPHHRHHRHHRHHHHRYGTEMTTIVNDVINNSIEKTEPETDENTPRRPWGRLVLQPSCIYLKIKATNTSTSLVDRGCGYMPADKDFCTVVKKINGNITECKSCNTDECN